jgi:hypothetical protein
MRKRLLVSVLTILVAAVCLSGQAIQAQEGKKKVLVLGADADLGAADLGKVLAATRAQVAMYPDIILLDTPTLDLLDEMVEYECLDLDGECLAKIGARYAADLMIYTRYTKKGDVHLQLIQVSDGAVVGQYKGTSDVAGLAPVAGETAVVAMLGPVPVKVTPVQVTINANIEGAEVSVNDSIAGTTPVSVELLPGTHTVTVRKEGFLMVEEKLRVAGTDPISWSATLKPLPQKKVAVAPPPEVKVTDLPPTGREEKEREGKAFYKTWWFWTAVGVGTAAIITGTALALGGSEAQESGTVKFSVHPSAAEKDAVFYFVP